MVCFPLETRFVVASLTIMDFLVRENKEHYGLFFNHDTNKMRNCKPHKVRNDQENFIDL